MGSEQIADNAVTSAKIEDDAVGSDQIADDAVGSDQIAAGAVGSEQIADNITQIYFAGQPDTSTIASDGIDYNFKLSEFSDVITEMPDTPSLVFEVVNPSLDGNTSIVFEAQPASLTINSGVLTAFASHAGGGFFTNITSTAPIELTPGLLTNVNSQFDDTNGKTQGLSYVSDVNFIVPTQENNIEVNKQIKIFSKGSILFETANGPGGGVSGLGPATGFGISNTGLPPGQTSTLTTNIDLELQYGTVAVAAAEINQIIAPAYGAVGQLSKRKPIEANANTIYYDDDDSSQLIGDVTIKSLNPDNDDDVADQDSADNSQSPGASQGQIISDNTTNVLTLTNVNIGPNPITGASSISSDTSNAIQYAVNDEGIFIGNGATPVDDATATNVNTGHGATFKVTSVDENGVPTAIEITEGGNGYTDGHNLLLKRTKNDSTNTSHGSNPDQEEYALATIQVLTADGGVTTESGYFHNYATGLNTASFLMNGLRSGMKVKTAPTGTGVSAGDLINTITVIKRIEINNRVRYDLELTFLQSNGAARTLNSATSTSQSIVFENNKKAIYVVNETITAANAEVGAVLAWKVGTNAIQSSEVVTKQSYAACPMEYQVIDIVTPANNSTAKFVDSGFSLLITQTDISPKDETPTIYSMPFVSVRVNAITPVDGASSKPGDGDGQVQAVLVRPADTSVTLSGDWTDTTTKFQALGGSQAPGGSPLGIIKNGDTLVFTRGVLTSGQKASGALSAGTKVEFEVGTQTVTGGNTTFTGTFTPFTSVAADDILFLEKTSNTNAAGADGTTIKDVNRFILKLEAALTGAVYNPTGPDATKISILLSANEGVVIPNDNNAIYSGLGNNNIASFNSQTAVLPSINAGTFAADTTASIIHPVTPGTEVNQYKFTNGLPFSVVNFILTHNAQPPAFYIGGQLDGNNNKTNLGVNVSNLLTIIFHNLPTAAAGLVKGQLYQNPVTGVLKVVVN